ncbi:MAG: leucyl aminopeptidase [Deltaproteobacteria bacterium]|jgi:leucyl aminopeptidase|nr:leucyl aminopeptidase [Deltaproteobacteria bacterium]
MNLKYLAEALAGPLRPGLILFLRSGAQALADRPELAAFQPLVQPHLTTGAFKGGFLDFLPLHVQDGWLLLIGLGDLASLTEERLLEAGAKAAKRAAALNLREVFLALPPLAYEPDQTLELLTVGAQLGLDERGQWKSGPPEPSPLKQLTVVNPTNRALTVKPKEALKRAAIMAEAQIRARRLSDQPACELTPEGMAQEALALGLALKLKVSVWDEKKLAAERAGGLLAVGRGSVHPPRLVTLEYQGRPGGAGPLTALVGKGVTFDSGGLCLKSQENMGAMKTDMAGAAAVLAVVGAAAAARLPVRLAGLLPLAENMPDGAAFRPGDVATMLSGQTVEIVNTDAEGRLLLADALTAAQRLKPDRLIDVATLTGACQVALGERCAGLFCDDQRLREAIIDSGREVGESCWPLPLFEPYEENLKSGLADFRQAASRAGGAIHAALFLRKFVPKGLPWAHLDIAGTGRRSLKVPSGPEGATGFGVRTLFKLLTKLS